MSEYEGKYIKVKILEGGKTAGEVNPFGKKPNYDSSCFNGGNKIFHISYERNKWCEVESRLRTFEIEEIFEGYAKEIIHKSRGLYFAEICQELIGKIKFAEILPNGKVRIL